VNEVDADLSEAEAQLEWESEHELPGGLARVRERPCDGEPPQLAIVGGGVRATAVLFLARYRVVVVAVDRRDPALGDQVAHLVRVRAVSDHVTAAVDTLDTKILDLPQRGPQRRQVGVDVCDDSDRAVVLHATILFNRQTSV